MNTTAPIPIKLKYKYTCDKNGVPSYSSKRNNNNPATRHKLTGKHLEAAQRATRANRRILHVQANGNSVFKKLDA